MSGCFLHKMINDDELLKLETSRPIWETWVEQFIAFKNSLAYKATPSYQKHTKQHWEETFESMGWNKNLVLKFWYLFWDIIKSRTGELTIDEFLKYFGLRKTRYTTKCFEYFDSTGGGDVDLLEFIVSVWNVCPVAPKTLAHLAFDLYNLNSDGELSLPEIEYMVIEMFGLEPGHITGLAKECLDDLMAHSLSRAGVMNVDAFCNVVQRHSMLLFPIFEIQTSIRNKVLGNRYWKQAYAERVRQER